VVELPPTSTAAAADLKGPAVPATLASRDALRPAIEVRDATRSFRGMEVLRGVSLEVWPGQIHALLGPNGAGKTTLLRILTGLVLPSTGDVTVLGHDQNVMTSRGFRRSFGFIPSGDRTFYLRLSGLENLMFFGRLHGISRRHCRDRAMELLEAVGLADAATRRVGMYSHGMQKRLSVARGLLTDPGVLFVDEATHDLDPDAADTIRGLVAAQAARGVAVMWTTQRVEEIRGFADRVTLLHHGQVRFEGSVPQLLAAVPRTRFLLRIGTGTAGVDTVGGAAAALQTLGEVRSGIDDEHVILALRDGSRLGTAIARLEEAGIPVLACAEERSGLEEAFLFLTRGQGS
jgi:ABC-2 type transport system ATP-binding protein